jgi:CHAT domain-containing protein
VRDPVGEAVTLSNIGNVYLELGEEQKALDYYNQALPLRRAVADRRGEAQTLNNIGTVYLDLKEGQKALDYYNQALPLARAVGDRVSEADTLDNLGRDYWNMGEKQNALDHFSESLPLRRAVGDRAGEATTLAALESFFSSQPDLAIFFGKLAVNTLQSIRRDNQGLNQNLQRTYEASISTHYRSLASSLIDRGRFGETEEVLTLLKDKEASDVVRRDAVTDQLRPATLLDPEKRAFARYEEILSKPDTASSALAAFLEGQQKAFAADTSIATRAAEFKEPDGLQDTLRRLGPDVAAIYTLLAPDKYVAMLVTSGTRQAYTTQIKEADLNKKIFDFRRKLQDPTSDPVPLARELYAIVFPEGLRRDLDATHARTIMWSIDNTLRYLPIAALHDGHDYLVKSFRNSLITHESLAQLAAQPAPKWQGAGFGVSDASPPLPSVPLELKSIFRQDAAGSGAIPGTVRLNAQFTRTSFEIDLKRKHNDVVHIATHFDSRPGVAANSHLILGDGQMSLAEIESKPGLFDGVELLTLSACNTAFTNRNEDGREVDSFGTIAQRLGAKSVIASLWSVNDPATARFMEAVYRLREQEGIPKNEALRQAQEAMLSGKLAPSGAAEADRGVRPAGAESHKASSNWSHPFFWAPFILIGNWK